jgi:hypothetical protein
MEGEVVLSPPPTSGPSLDLVGRRSCLKYKFASCRLRRFGNEGIFLLHTLTVRVLFPGPQRHRALGPLANGFQLRCVPR